MGSLVLDNAAGAVWGDRELVQVCPIAVRPKVHDLR